MIKIIYLISIFLIVTIGLAGCNSGGEPVGNNQATPAALCGPYSDWEGSAYILPYAVGEEYVVNQANCSGFGHSDFWLYGYDFIMDIGTPVHAMRSGEVVHIVDGIPDGVRSATNLILVMHDDDTVALYSHLTNGGVLVGEGQLINQGDIIGLSGDTGNTGGLPHLHVSLHPCIGLPGLIGIPQGNCDTQPFNFSNTEANPDGLVARRKYQALPF